MLHKHNVSDKIYFTTLRLVELVGTKTSVIPTQGFMIAPIKGGRLYYSWVGFLCHVNGLFIGGSKERNLYCCHILAYSLFLLFVINQSTKGVIVVMKIVVITSMSGSL